MKRFLLLSMICIMSLAAKAMSYEEARERAWFLTDKMAYELNLTTDQYDRAYQINLDYLMSMRSPSDCNGIYWQYRDMDLRCILFDWQYNLYRTLDYFFRPIRWVHSAWYYPISHYYRTGYYYFDRPGVYISYRGGLWRRRSHNDPSPYISHRPQRGFGMRDHYHGRNPYPGGHDKNPGHNNFRPGHNGNSHPDRPNNQGNNRPDRPNTTFPNTGGNHGNRPGGNNPTRPGGSNNQRPDSDKNRPGNNTNTRPVGTRNFGTSNNRTLKQPRTTPVKVENNKPSSRSINRSQGSSFRNQQRTPTHNQSSERNSNSRSFRR